MEDFLFKNQDYLIELLLSALFSFLIGMSIYMRKKDEDIRVLYGTERTFVFITILGFILFKAREVVPLAYIVGFIVLAAFLLLYYYRKGNESNYGITSIIVGLIIYTLPVIFHIFPMWLGLLILVIIMVLLEVKTQVKSFASRLYKDEFLTLAKFVFISGVILPIVPNEDIITGIPISPYKLWLAIVAISGISYFSYLLKKYVFPSAGLILTGILGGLYSSTATTFILSRKSKEKADSPSKYAAAILVAIVMMYIRIFILMYIFLPTLGIVLLPHFAIMTVISALVSFLVFRFAKDKQKAVVIDKVEQRNPLELRIALIFGLLYVVFTLSTHYTLEYFGDSGLRVLSIIIGLTDIDPFLLSLFQGKYASLTLAAIGIASMQAIISNNFLKMIFAITLGDKGIRKFVIFGFAVIVAANIVLIFFI